MLAHSLLCYFILLDRLILSFPSECKGSISAGRYQAGGLGCDLLNKAGPSGGEGAYFPFTALKLNEMEIKIQRERTQRKARWKWGLISIIVMPHNAATR